MTRLRMLSMAAITLATVAGNAFAQVTQANASDTAPKKARFFDSEEPLRFTLTVNLKQLRRDRNPVKSPYHAATIAYRGTGPDSAPVVVPLRIKTRGIWRLQNCDLPPIRFHFSKVAAKHSIFAKQRKPKLVTYCRDSDEYEQNLLLEFQLYRLYHLLTPIGPRVRLAKITYADSGSGKPAAQRYGYLLEDIAEYAERVGGEPLPTKGARPDDLDPFQSALFGVWEYFIGNTDFSIAALHNVQLVERDTSVYPVPYDYDWSGVVNARYAHPDPRLGTRSVRERIFRGYCVPEEYFAKVFALFNAKKAAIYSSYADPIGKLIPPDRIKDTLEYFDEFYATINDPRVAKRDIVDACLGER